MDGHRHVDAMNDPSLDREIESLLATEPSPEFVARVRARVASEPEPGGWRLPFIFSTAGAVAVVIVAVIAWPSREPVPSGDTRVQSPHVAEAIETATSQGPLAPLQPVQGQRARARAVAVAASPDRAIEIDLPEVVIAENEVKAYTTLAAWSGFEEGAKGSLEEGKLADFVVLDRDLFGIDLDEIRHVRPVMTVVNGEVRFETAVGG